MRIPDPTDCELLRPQHSQSLADDVSVHVTAPLQCQCKIYPWQKSLPGPNIVARTLFIANSSSHLLPAELPEAVGYCDEENLYLAIPTFGSHQYWNLYLGNKPLNRHVALTSGYLAATNSTHLILQIPLFAMGVIYEVRYLYSNAFFKARRAVWSHSHSPTVTACSAAVLTVLKNLWREGI